MGMLARLYGIWITFFYQPLVRFIRQFFSWLEALFVPTQSVLFVTIYGVIVIVTDQTQDVLVHLMEWGDSPAAWVLRLVAILVGLGLFSACAWYMARVLYTYQVVLLVAQLDRHPRLQSYWPRVLGGLVYVFTLVALATAGWHGGRALAWGCGVLIAAVALAGAAYAYVVIRRRRWFGKKARGKGALEDDVAKAHGSVAKLGQLGRAPFVLTAVMLAIGVWAIWFFGRSEFPFWLTDWPAFSALLVLLVALSVLTVVFTILTWISRTSYVPAYLLLLILAGVFAWFGWSDNHGVRTADKAQWIPAAAPLPETLAAQVPGLGAGEAPLPVVFVAAEGGGIRAAYWTARVLAELHCQRAEPGPPYDATKRMVAFSGISGGSLGGAVFAAWLRQPEAWGGDRDACRNSAKAKIRGMLSRDFLTPVFASMLFPDTAQRWLPWNVFPDRAQVMEQAWERGWERATRPGSGQDGSDQLKQPLSALWSPPGAGFPRDWRMPLLFLNSALVESGRPLIVAPYRFDRTSFHCWFVASEQAADLMPSTVALSTAALLSARFTWVSPAGRIPPEGPREAARFDPPSGACPRGTLLPDNRGWFRAVDGGYYDTPAAHTAGELLAALASLDPHRRLRPVMIQIGNDPMDDRGGQKRWRNKHNFLPEILSPPVAIWDVRTGHGESTLEGARAAAVSAGGLFAHFALCKTRVGLPLGWALSDSAMNEMDRQLGLPPEGGGASTKTGSRHRGTIQRVLSFLQHPPKEAKPIPAPGDLVTGLQCRGEQEP